MENDHILVGLIGGFESIETRNQEYNIISYEDLASLGGMACLLIKMISSRRISKR